MKVAFSTMDGKTICGHMGRAKYFMILTLKDNQVIDKEMVENGMKHHAHQSQHDHTHQRHEDGHSHNPMIEVLSDCSVVFTQGMGQRLINDLDANHIKGYIVQENDIDTALTKWLNNELPVTEVSECCHH